MAPRYGGQTVNAPYQQHLHGHGQAQHPQQQQQQHQHHSVLPPPHLGAPAFSGASVGATSFAIPGTGSGFDRGVADAGLLVGQSNQYLRGGPVQPHQTFDGTASLNAPKDDPRIRNVWRHNLKQELATLRELVDEYPYIAMDTEFPGIIARPIGSFTTKADYHYQTLRCNVDLLKMIQLGITLFKADGSTPSTYSDNPSRLIAAPCTWQFNFQFSLQSDMYAADSTTMLSKAGLDFSRHEAAGIDPHDFGALLISSGLVLVDNVRWISFHSGYDFGYLMKIMMQKELPRDEQSFHDLLDLYFPALLDIKYIVKMIGSRGSVNNNQTLTAEASLIINNINQKSGLQDLANELGIQRIGIQHQAGSDSLLTGQVYFKMREKIFNGTIDEHRYVGQVWGLNGQMPNQGLTSTQMSSMNGASTAFQMGGASNGASAANPSTPQTGHAALASQTPGPPHSSHGASTGSFGNLTPGAFGNFSYKSMG